MVTAFSCIGRSISTLVPLYPLRKRFLLYLFFVIIVLLYLLALSNTSRFRSAFVDLIETRIGRDAGPCDLES